MTRPQHKRYLAALSVGLSCAAMAGCQTTTSLVPAVLNVGDDVALETLKAVLAAAVGQARVDLGPSDPASNPALTVLPPKPGPLEGRSPATPIAFDLMTDGETCFIIRRDTGEQHKLNSITCRAL